MTYRDSAIDFWGQAGAVAYDAYADLRAAHFPDLPVEVPIVIGIAAYGRCDGLTRASWEYGPRISLASTTFAAGLERVRDTLLHEMLHVALALRGHRCEHNSDAWYAAVRALSPAVLGQSLTVRRGAQRTTLRVANPDWTPGSGQPKTVPRKVPVDGAIPHRQVSGWPMTFRPDDYDWGAPVPCPTY